MSEAVRSLAPPVLDLAPADMAGVSGDWALIRLCVSESCRIFCFCSKVRDDEDEVMLVMGASFLFRSVSIRPVAKAPVSFLPTNDSSPRPEYIWSISEVFPPEGAATNWSGLARPSDMLICKADLENEEQF